MYSFPLPNTKRNLYQIFAYGILLLNITGMSFILMAQRNNITQMIIQAIIFIAMVAWDIVAYKKGRRFLPVGILLLAYGVFWLRFGANWAFAINLFLWLLYTISKRNLLITVSKEHVIYPSFPKKILQWSELSNVILKDDILTIDCKNNKVYQHLVRNSSQFANEDAFNDFCRKHLLQTNL